MTREGPRSESIGASRRPAPGVVLGATGLVGGHLVDLLLEAGARVRAPGRRPPAREHPSLSYEPLDLDALLGGDPRATRPFEGVAWAAICLGTTMRRAGSREAFQRVDHHYVVGAARAALEGGATRLAVVSSVGAKPDARSFYLKVKGETERDLIGLGAPELTIARPSLLAGERAEHRPGERWALRILTPLRPLLRGPLAALAPIPAVTVARALTRMLLDPPDEGDDPIVRILEPEDLRALA